MSEICRFLGIVIRMYHRDQSPPHFHVSYSGYRAVVGIDDLSVLEGRLPPRIFGLVVEWAMKNREALRANWTRARQLEPLRDIAPLDRGTGAMLKDVISVRNLAGYWLRVRFEDGVEGDVDVSSLLPFEGVFAPLKNPHEFNQVRVNAESGTIEWPCGADINPIILYSAVSGIPIPDYSRSGSRA
jgi:hypothetical protein